MTLEFETALSLARHLAEIRGSRRISSIATTIRDLIQQGIIEPSAYASAAKTAPALLNPCDTARAIILLHLNRLGLSHDLLAAIAPKLNNLAGFRDDSVGDRTNEETTDRLGWVLTRLKQGHSFFLHIYLSPGYYDLPGNVRGAEFSARCESNPHTFDEAVITVPLWPLLAPYAQHSARATT